MGNSQHTPIFRSVVTEPGAGVSRLPVTKTAGSDTSCQPGVLRILVDSAAAERATFDTRKSRDKARLLLDEGACQPAPWAARG
jgi:hypothetical protein